MVDVLAIVQARMDSTRLPKKVMLNLHGYPIIEWVYRRVAMAQKVDKLICAIPDTPSNDGLEKYIFSMGGEVFRGSENDLVDRFYQVIRKIQPKVVVRICADNPLISPCEIDALIDFFKSRQCDYAYNHIPNGWGGANGLGAEIASASLIEMLNHTAKSAAHREHVFNYIWDHRQSFRIECPPVPKELSYPELRFDVDTYDDYQKLASMPLNIDFSSRQIVDCALHKCGDVL